MVLPFLSRFLSVFLLSGLHTLPDKGLLILAPHSASRYWSLSLSLDLVLARCSLLLPQDHWILAIASSVGLQHQSNVVKTNVSVRSVSASHELVVDLDSLELVEILLFFLDDQQLTFGIGSGGAVLDAVVTQLHYILMHLGSAN